MIKKVMSGGQTGVEQAALDATIEATSLRWGGHCPRHRVSLHAGGAIPERYFSSKRIDCGLVETGSSRYKMRTRLNVLDSDATLVIRRGPFTEGSKLSIFYCQKIDRPYKDIEVTKPYAVPRIVRWICENGFEKLNVAGSEEQQRPGIYHQAKVTLTDILLYVRLYQTKGIKIWKPQSTVKS